MRKSFSLRAFRTLKPHRTGRGSKTDYILGDNKTFKIKQEVYKKKMQNRL